MTEMTRRNITLLAALAVLAVAPAMAQDDVAETGPAAEPRDQTIDVQMREAEQRLTDAAARIAELSNRRLPRIVSFQRLWAPDRAALGITIGSTDGSAALDEPVKGVTVTGVTPGSAAAEAGLRAGDVITSVNDVSLNAPGNSAANARLLDAMTRVEVGDTLQVKYRRDGKNASVKVKAEPLPNLEYGFASRGERRPPMPPMPTMAPAFRWFGYFAGGGGWGDMEMVALTGELGRYFGTDSGLLVVRAPADESLKLQDGDVIQSIDGREPASVAHAMRILGSYRSGEKLEIEIMRDKKHQTLTVEMPNERHGDLSGQGFVTSGVRLRTRHGMLPYGVLPHRVPTVRMREDRI